MILTPKNNIKKVDGNENIDNKEEVKIEEPKVEEKPKKTRVRKPKAETSTMEPKKETKKRTTKKKTEETKKEDNITNIEDKPKKTTKTTKKNTATTTKSTTKKATTKGTSKKEKEEVVENEYKRSTLFGDRECYCYFSVKLTNNSHDADVISVALVSYDGDSIYIENSECDKSKCNSNTIDIFNNKIEIKEEHLDGHVWMKSCKKNEIGVTIAQWLDIHYFNKGKVIQFVGDKVFYEFTFLKELFVKDAYTFLNLPINITVLDLNQVIADSIIGTNKELETEPNYLPTSLALQVDRIVTFENIIKSLPDSYKLSDYSVIQYNIWKNHNPNEDAMMNAIMTRVIHQDICLLR